MVIKADIRKGSTYIKNQLKAYERENPYDLSLNGKIQIVTQFYLEYIFIFVFCFNTGKEKEWIGPPQSERKANQAVDVYFRVVLIGTKGSSKVITSLFFLLWYYRLSVLFSFL